MNDILGLLSRGWEGGPVQNLPPESEIERSCRVAEQGIGDMPTDIPPAVVEAIFLILWKNLPHEHWSAKDELRAWLNLALVDKATMKLMRQFTLHFGFSDALTPEQVRWLRVTDIKAKVIKLSANESPCSFLHDDEDNCGRSFMSRSSSSTLRSLCDFPLSPNFRNAAHHGEHCQSCRGDYFFPAHGTLTDEDVEDDCHYDTGSPLQTTSLHVPELLTFPESLSTLSLSVVNARGSQFESCCSALHLRSTFFRLLELQTLSVTAQCLFTDLSFDAGSLPSLKHLHLRGVNISNALVASLPLLESASWEAIVLRNSDAHSPAGRDSRDSLLSSSVWEPLALSVSASDDELGSLAAPIGGFDLGVWCRRARKVTVTTLTTLVRGARGWGPWGLAGVTNPSPELLEEIAQSRCEELTLRFHEHKRLEGQYVGEVGDWKAWQCALSGSHAIRDAFDITVGFDMLSLSGTENVDAAEIVLKRRSACL